MSYAHFSGPYGVLAISLATEFKPYLKFTLLDVPADCVLDKSTATQVDLITEGQGCLVRYYGKDQGYITVENAAGHIAAARIDKIKFNENVHPDDRLDFKDVAAHIDAYIKQHPNEHIPMKGGHSVYADLWNGFATTYNHILELRQGH